MQILVNNLGLQKILPYRYPFLLIDRVENYSVGKTITAIKNITANEWPFTDADYPSSHYPETLLIEAAAQAALVLYHLTFADDCQRLFPVIGRVYADFSAQVNAGDHLKLTVLAGKFMRQGGYATTEIFSRESKCAEIKLMYGVVPRSPKRW
ncbi:MAG: 3-hydroxyacyl-ACP dehydratase FabZ family protein [Candidatus Omnitrophota bacterium]|jgi:3-hydroxyacyl-[acyl-carrier-protein] dehydratase